MLRDKRARPVSRKQASVTITPEQLGCMGHGIVAYVRPITWEALASLVPQAMDGIPQTSAPLYLTCDSAGQCLAISDTHTAACGYAMGNNLIVQPWN